MKGNKQSMNDFGSNNLVPQVHVLYLNADTKRKKKQVCGPNFEGCRPPSTTNCPSQHIDMMGKAYEGHVQKMGLIGPLSPIGRRVNFGQLISSLVWVGETHCSSALSHRIYFVLSLDGGCASPMD
jgi:hypothetical protein